jgi:hypothetical protein
VLIGFGVSPLTFRIAPVEPRQSHGFDYNGLDSKSPNTFIWTGDLQCHGSQCKASWTLLCEDKNWGGLGVKDLTIQNRGLLSKFLSMLHQPPTTNWQRWFRDRYGSGARRNLGDPHRLDTLVWTTLLKLLPEFQSCTKVHLGDGEHCSFWFDHWLGPQPLATLFPALLTHCKRPNMTVMTTSRGEGDWAFFLHPRLTDGAEDEP